MAGRGHREEEPGDMAGLMTAAAIPPTRAAAVLRILVDMGATTAIITTRTTLDLFDQRGSDQDCSISNRKFQGAQPAAVVTTSPNPGGLKAAQPATIRAKPTSAATVPSTMKGIQPVKAGERPTVSIAKPAPGAMSTHPAAKVPPVSAKPGEKPQMSTQAAAALKAKHAAAGAWFPTRIKPLSQPRRQLAQGAGGSARA